MADEQQLGTTDRPLRVVVIGSSTVFLTVPPATERGDDVYAGWLQRDLRALGVEAGVVVHSQWHATVREVLPRFEEWVHDELPDVVVVNLGMADCQARVLPTWLLRNTMTWLPGQGAVAARYRAGVVPRIREPMRHWQRFWAGRVGERASRVRPAVFVRSMSRLVSLTVKQCNADVLLLDIDPPNARLLHWMPGLDQRVDRYNRLLEQVVAAGPAGRVQLVRTSSVVAAEPDRLLPDGLHRSAAGHRLVSAHLARVIADRYEKPLS